MSEIYKKRHRLRITKSDALDRYLSDLDGLILKVKNWKKGKFGTDPLVEKLITCYVAIFTKVNSAIEQYVPERNLYRLLINQKYNELMSEYENPRKERA